MAVARARGYPWGDRAHRPPVADPDAFAAAVAAGAIPLVAYGSNASAVVLEAKLGAAHASAVLARPVVLRDLDVVFSAHVSAHGAVPAMVHPVAGTRALAWLLAIPAAAIGALDATEPNYDRRALGDVQAYVSRHGALQIGGAPVALAAVRALGRRVPSRSEAELLELVRRAVDPAADPDAFVLEAIRDPGVRVARREVLRAGLPPGRGLCSPRSGM